MEVGIWAPERIGALNAKQKCLCLACEATGNHRWFLTRGMTQWELYFRTCQADQGWSWVEEWKVERQHFLNAYYLPGILNTSYTLLILTVLLQITCCCAHFIGQLKFKDCKRCYSYVEEQRSEPIWIKVSLQNLYVFCCISCRLEKENLISNWNKSGISTKVGTGRIRRWIWEIGR